MDRVLTLEFVRVTEAAAVKAGRLMGKGDKMGADQLAVDGMHSILSTVPIDGTVVIGEGESIVFDWEPTMTSAAELMAAPRGTDPRLAPNARRTTTERREQYYERMDAKAVARAEVEEQRLAAYRGEDE